MTPDQVDNLPAAAPAVPGPDRGEQKKALLKAGLLAVGLVVLFAFVYFSPLRSYLRQNTDEIHTWLNQCGRWGPVVFALAAAVLVALGVPRLLLCALGGFAFGVVSGVLWSCLGTLLGYYGIFLFVRWGGKDFMLRHHHMPARLTGLLRQQGIPAVILIRQMPVHGMVANLVLGLSPVRHRDFLIGTAIGLLPEAIPLALIGAGAMKGEFSITSLYFVLGAVILAMVWIFLDRSGRKSALEPAAPSPN